MRKADEGKTVVSPADILITGSSGQIGSYTIDEAARAGLRARGLDLRPSSWTKVLGDVRSMDSALAAAKGCRAVVHLAAQISVQQSIEDPRNDADHNLGGTVTMLEAARRFDASRLVFVSTAGVYGRPERTPISEDHPTRPLSPYGLSKLAAEGYVRYYAEMYGMNASIVRLFNVYSMRQDPSNPYTGVLSKFAARVLSRQAPIVFGSGSQTRDFVHASDVSHLLVRIASGNITPPRGTAINVGSGTETSILQLARMFLRVAKLELEPILEDARPGEIDRSVADVARLQKLGFSPKVNIEQGVREFVSAAGKPKGGGA